MTHRERQFLQYLRDGSWVKAGTAPGGSKMLRKLLVKSWIEQRQEDMLVTFRITDAGLEAKMMPVRMN